MRQEQLVISVVIAALVWLSFETVKVLSLPTKANLTKIMDTRNIASE